MARTNHQGLTLTQALKDIGIKHKRSSIVNKHDWFDEDGNLLGTFDAAEGWAEYERRYQELENRWADQRGRQHYY